MSISFAAGVFVAAFPLVAGEAACFEVFGLVELVCANDEAVGRLHINTMDPITSTHMDSLGKRLFIEAPLCFSQGLNT
jgi:hypothetical protein